MHNRCPIPAQDFVPCEPKDPPPVGANRHDVREFPTLAHRPVPGTELVEDPVRRPRPWGLPRGSANGRRGKSSSRFTGDNEAVVADVERWLDTRADAAKRSLDGAGLDRHAETSASRQITSTLADAHAAGDIVAIIDRPGRGKTWALERYCAGRTGVFEQDTSAVLFLFGETYYLAKEKPSTTNLVAHDESAERPEMVRHKGEVYGVKSRQGWTMEITLLWLGSTMSYQDMLSDERREL